MPKANLVKADPAGGALASLQELMGKLREQAANKQIDGALLEQAAAMVDMQVASNAAPDEVVPAAAAAAKGAEVAQQPPMPAAKAAAIQPEDANAPVEEVETAPADEVEPESTEVPPMVNKNDMPAEGRPPLRSYSAPNLVFDQVDEMQAKVPQFIKAMYSGSVREAQKVVGFSQIGFDNMMNLSMHSILEEGGWTSNNLNKINGSAQMIDQNQLAKAVTSSSVPGIYLIKLAKLMLPVYAGIVNRMPSGIPQMGSNQSTWKAQLGFGAINEAGGFRNAEAAIGQVPPTSFLTYNAPFNDVSYNDSVTLKAIRSGAGYSDPLQISVIKSMAALLRLQEKIILGSNAVAIAAPGTVTASGSTTGGTMAAGSHIVGVTALTYEGWLAGSSGSSNAVGESTATYATVLVTTGSTSQIAMSWPAVPGAVAYNIYASGADGTSATAYYIKTVMVNKAACTIDPTGTRKAPPADTSVNAYGIEGLLQWCELSTVYGNATPNKTSIVDLAGAGLTAANGGITQIDTILASLATNWQISPTVMYMSPTMNNMLTGKILSLNSAATYKIEVANERGAINGGMMVSGYTNKFMSVGDGMPKFIDIVPHPYMPDGTILLASETIPYPMGNETRGFVRDVLLPYTYFPLASTTVQYNYALTTSETLECFLPSAQTAIVGVDVTL